MPLLKVVAEQNFFKYEWYEGTSCSETTYYEGCPEGKSRKISNCSGTHITQCIAGGNEDCTPSSNFETWTLYGNCQ